MRGLDATTTGPQGSAHTVLQRARPSGIDEELDGLGLRTGVQGAWRINRVHSSDNEYCIAPIVSKRLQPCFNLLWNWAKKARIGLPGLALAQSSKTCSNCFSRLARCSAESWCSGAMSGGVTSSVRCFLGGGSAAGQVSI